MAGALKPAVAIVGGGWAGLAAAVELTDAGFPVTLYEAARQLGGRARSVDWDGLRIDNGQHLLAGAYDQTLALMRRLGTLPLLERRRLDLRGPGFRLVLPRLPAPWHLAAGLLIGQGLSLADKLAAVRFMRSLQGQRFRLPADRPVAELLAAHRQPAGLIERLWQPICLAALNTPVALASGQVFCNVLRDSLAGTRSASDMLFCRADIGRLVPEAARERILAGGGCVRLSSRVEGVAFDDGSYRLSGTDLPADRVIIATHPARVPDLVAGLPEMGAITERLRRFTWQPILTTWLRFADPVRLPYPMLALGPGSAPWAFERGDIAPGLVAIVASADGPHLRQPPEQLRDAWLAALTGMIGPLPRLLAWKTIVEKRATFSCVANLDRPDSRTPLRGLYLAGDYTAGDYPATLEGAVRSGVECARLIQESA